MKIGYARVSTIDQNLDSQIDELKKFGCEKIFSCKISTRKEEQTVLEEAIDYCRTGDTLVIFHISRLHRSLIGGLKYIKKLVEKNVHIKSLRDGDIDTSTPNGKLIVSVLLILCEWQRDSISVNTKAGLASGRARGKFGGRPKKLNDKDVEFLVQLHKNNNNNIKDICKKFGISQPTLHNYVKKFKNKNASVAEW